MASLIAIYVGFSHGFDVPNFEDIPCGRDNLSPECNFGAYIDQNIFGRKYMYWP